MFAVLISNLFGSIPIILHEATIETNESVRRMDFYYGRKSDFPGCFVPITRTGVEMLKE